MVGIRPVAIKRERNGNSTELPISLNPPKQLQDLGYEFCPTFSTPNRLYFNIYLPDPEEEKRRYHIHLTYPENNERSIWAKMVGYNRRVVAESMIARWKKLYGGELRSRCAERCKKEVKLKAMIINAMIDHAA